MKEIKIDFFNLITKFLIAYCLILILLKIILYNNVIENYLYQIPLFITLLISKKNKIIYILSIILLFLVTQIKLFSNIEIPFLLFYLEVKYILYIICVFLFINFFIRGKINKINNLNFIYKILKILSLFYLIIYYIKSMLITNDFFFFFNTLICVSIYLLIIIDLRNYILLYKISIITLFFNIILFPLYNFNNLYLLIINIFWYLLICFYNKHKE